MKLSFRSCGGAAEALGSAVLRVRLFGWKPLRFIGFGADLGETKPVWGEFEAASGKFWDSEWVSGKGFGELQEASRKEFWSVAGSEMIFGGKAGGIPRKTNVGLRRDPRKTVLGSSGPPWEAF